MWPAKQTSALESMQLNLNIASICPGTSALQWPKRVVGRVGRVMEVASAAEICARSMLFAAVCVN